jgi:tRNA(Ser,Leu) C12 N-acetylase TAN1
MTAVEWLVNELSKTKLTKDIINEKIKEAIEMEKQQIKDYAIFSVNCDRKGLPVLDFEDYIKLQSNL